MIDVHTLYLTGLVSQATFALTLILLAWSDRRTRGTRWLAGACALQFAWTAARSLSGGRVNRMSETFSACLLVVLLYSVFVGFRWFVKQRGVESEAEFAAIGGAILLVLATAVIKPTAAVLMGRLVALFLGVRTVAMLWMAPAKGLRGTARVCAVILALTLGIIAFNILASLPMETLVTAHTESTLTVIVRSATVGLVTLLSFSFVAIFVAETNRRLHEETRTDVLTGLRNRRAMEEDAVREVRSAIHHETPLALLMMDLDRFKQLNDTWGHALGDRALRAVGEVLLRGTGSRDVTARMGGEEFAVLLPGHSLQSAQLVAEKLRLKVADLRLLEGESEASLTASIGVSVLRPGEFAWTQMLSRADDALYRAKREGRDRVAVCSASMIALVDRPEAKGSLRAILKAANRK